VALASDIVLAAHRLIGLIRVGQAAAANESAESLLALNALVENWSVERLNIFSIGHAGYALTSGQQVYTYGPGGNFNGPRPIKIVSAFVQIGSGGAGNHSYALDLMDETGWRAIRQRGATSEVARKMYCDYAFPSSTIYLWPQPLFTGSVTLELETWTQLQGWATLATDVPLATGYLRALEYALAVELGPHFGLPIKPEVAQIADEAKAAIRALNGAPSSTDTTGAAPLNATPKGNQ